MRRESPFSDAGNSTWARPSTIIPSAPRKLATGHQDQLPLVALVDFSDQPAMLRILPVQFFAQSTGLGLQLRYVALEVDYLPHASEVHSHLLGQPLYVASEVNVLLRIEPGVLYALARTEKTLLLVHPYGLRMHHDVRGGYPDHVHRTLSEAHERTFLK